LKKKQEFEAVKMLEQAKQQKEESEREDCTVLVNRLHLKSNEQTVY